MCATSSTVQSSQFSAPLWVKYIKCMSRPNVDTKNYLWFNPQFGAIHNVWDRNSWNGKLRHIAIRLGPRNRKKFPEFEYWIKSEAIVDSDQKWTRCTDVAGNTSSTGSVNSFRGNAGWETPERSLRPVWKKREKRVKFLEQTEQRKGEKEQGAIVLRPVWREAKSRKKTEKEHFYAAAASAIMVRWLSVSCPPAFNQLLAQLSKVKSIFCEKKVQTCWFLLKQDMGNRLSGPKRVLGWGRVKNGPGIEVKKGRRGGRLRLLPRPRQLFRRCGTCLCFGWVSGFTVNTASHGAILCPYQAAALTFPSFKVDNTSLAKDY